MTRHPTSAGKGRSRSGGAGESLSAAILTGGQSRRMGKPKALLRLAQDDPAMIERIVACLRGGADEVFLVGVPAWPLPESLAGIRVVADSGQGAADGLVAALASAKGNFCVVVGCDMPFLDAGFLDALAGVARERDRSAVARDAAGRLHPLHAVYRRSDLACIEGLIAAGERSLVRMCDAIDAVPVEAGEDERRRWSVFNVNTPADLEVARAREASLKENAVHE